MSVFNSLFARIGLGVVCVCAGAWAFYEFAHRPGTAPGGGPEHPNVLIIMWDTVRADRLSAYGHDRPTTPHLDEFAREGSLYEQAISPGMWTLPSHASLFTGLPVSAHGATAYHKWLDSDFRRLGQVFQNHGYDTYLFSANAFISDMTNLVEGFDQTDYIWDAPWLGKTLTYVLSKLDRRDRSNPLAVRLNRAGSVQDSLQRPFVRSDLTQSGPAIKEAFEKWLNERESTQPFLAYLNYMEAHINRIPSMEARRRVMSPELVDRSLEVNQDHTLMMAYMFGRHDYSAEELAVISGVYDAALVDLDAATHELLDMMGERGILDETVVVITSDHGENLGDHGLMGHKFCVYNTLTHVPLIIRYPPRVPPGRISEPVRLLDLPATLLDLASIEPSKSSEHSVSLLADRPDRFKRRAMITEMLAPTPAAVIKVANDFPDLNWNPWMRWFRAVEMDGMKFIWASDGKHELYDLKADPNETNNLYASAPGRAEPLQRALEDWLGSFEQYDNSADGKEHSKPLSQEELERLRALGYAQ